MKYYRLIIVGSTVDLNYMIIQEQELMHELQASLMRCLECYVERHDSICRVKDKRVHILLYIIYIKLSYFMKNKHTPVTPLSKKIALSYLKVS